MSENKLDRGNLRRQAQRVESYKSLISRQKSTLKDCTPLRRLSSVEEPTKMDVAHYPSKDIEGEQMNKDNANSSGSSTPSPSSDSSQDFRINLCSSLKAIQKMPYQSECELSSVMTRSATRKYASVGSIHNRVNIDNELRVVKKWPNHIAYPTPAPPDDLTQLRDVVNRSFCEVLTFCKTAIAPEDIESEAVPEENIFQETPESFVDLSTFLTEESTTSNGGDENSITFHLSEDFTSHPFVNILALSEEDQDGTLVIQGEEEYETITLHSGETYLVDNKYFSNRAGSECNLNHVQSFSPPASSVDPLSTIHNDHTYAAPAKFIAHRKIIEPETPPKPKPPKNDENEFKLKNALNDLLLNTAILKCLVCNETPQEIVSQIDMAQSYLYSSNVG